ncbi:hypothetical protein Taro_045427 [Colocasia esculenta]|uniref:Gag-pol polyprotein n=1 Tax=Colocasia esculenta TaxID=4460 RepID=A0A843WWJ7_COLES|nr:hypothetical protein [Colocasia esculenta]
MERFKKMPPPSFKGESEPLVAKSWLREIKKIFKAIRCAEDDKVSLATYTLQEQFEGVELDVTWGEFVRLFEVKYVSEHIQDKMELYQEEKKARMKRWPEPFQWPKRKMRKLMKEQQPAIVPAKLVVSSGSKKPECVHCGKRHGGDLCWMRSGRCLKSGSKDHQIRGCLKLKKFVPRDVLATTTKKPTVRQEAPARVYALTGDDTDDGTTDRSDTRELAASTQFSVHDINETICLHKGNEQEEVDPRDLERRVESDVEEDSRDDEDEFGDDDDDDAELNIYGTWRTELDGFHVRWPMVRDPVHDKVCLPVRAGRPNDRYIHMYITGWVKVTCGN